MKPGSLRLRLLIAWAVFIFIAMQVAGFGLRALFERSILRRTISELNFDLDQLAKAIEIDAAGTVRLVRRGPSDPQFDVVDGGRYWQVDAADREPLQSTSLGQRNLQIPMRFNAPPTFVETGLIAPDGKPLIAVTRRSTLQQGDSGRKSNVRLTSAVNASEIREDTDKFALDLVHGLAWFALLLLTGAWAHVSIGLRPLENLRLTLARVRNGTARRIDGVFPSEVEPLVAETNELLDAQQRDIEIARARASDLAHGLKTPLAIMAAKSRLLRRNGHGQIADDIDRQIDVMNRHTQRELARARARGSASSAREVIDIGAATHELLAAIQTLPRAKRLEWSLGKSARVSLPMDRADFNDMVGNLLENALKWAERKVLIEIGEHHGKFFIKLDDDGPGIADEHLERVLRRGERADSSVEGTGLGLAIVGDLVEAYGGRLILAKSPLGGLSAMLELPDRRLV